MMSLNLMLDIVSGLNSKWQHTLADELCALWGCTDAVYIRASSNVIFRCKYNDKTFYLRFNKGKEQQWHNEIELLIHLHHHNMCSSWLSPHRSGAIRNGSSPATASSQFAINSSR